MSNFTPGPWEVGAQNGELVTLAGNEVIAKIEPTRDNKIKDANARLISATPEMCAILKALYEGPVPLSTKWYEPRSCRNSYHDTWSKIGELLHHIDGEDK